MAHAQEKVARVIAAVHPEWVKQFGENYIAESVASVLAGNDHEPPRANDAEETDVGMIAKALADFTLFILNLLSIAEKCNGSMEGIDEIKKRVADWPDDRKAILIEALMDQLD